MTHNSYINETILEVWSVSPDSGVLSLISEQSFILLLFTSNFTKKTLNEAWKSCCGRASDRVSSCCCFDGGFGEWWRFSRSTMARVESNVPDHNMKKHVGARQCWKPLGRCFRFKSWYITVGVASSTNGYELWNSCQKYTTHMGHMWRWLRRVVTVLTQHNG